jgi:hypothetical protein
MGTFSTSWSPSNRAGTEIVLPGTPNRLSPPSGSDRNSCRGVLLTLLLAAIVGIVVAVIGAYMLMNPQIWLDINRQRKGREWNSVKQSQQRF